jgi:hypothetical protein
MTFISAIFLMGFGFAVVGIHLVHLGCHAGFHPGQQEFQRLFHFGLIHFIRLIQTIQ